MIDQLTNHLWQSTLFAVAAGLLTLAFRGNRAQVRYWLWFSASFKFFVPFSLLLNLGSHLKWAPPAWVTPAWAIPAANVIAAEPVSITIVQMAQPFSVTTSLVPPASSTVNWLPLAILAVWACGFGLIALAVFRGWFRIRAAVRGSSPLNIPAPVDIRFSPGLLEPGVVGLFRPVLLLPEGIVERLTPAQLDAVLAHELCHVRRRDNLASACHMIVEAVFWFHPLVWWIGARLVEERERACDEAVLSLGSEPRIYADAIVNVCKLYMESPLACVSGVTGANLKRRIEAIMKNRMGKRLNGVRKFTLAAAGIVALAGPIAIGVIIGVGHAPAVHAQSPVTIPPTRQTVQAVPTSQTAQTSQPAPAAAASTTQDHRRLAMLFELSAMTSDEQSRARQSAIKFIQTGSRPDDQVAIMVGDGAKVTIAQDFTNDPVVLESAIRNLSAGAGDASTPRADRIVLSIETAANLLAAVPGKKTLIYFQYRFTSAGANDGARVSRAILAAQAANVALFMIDAQGVPVHSPSPGVLFAGYGIGPVHDEVRAKFGSESNARARTWLLHGPPDQIENRGANLEIWRYNYLENFHSRVEYEFPTGKSVGPRDMQINWPPPTGIYYGAPGATAALAEALGLGGRGGGAVAAIASTDIIPGLPAGHASLQTWGGGELQTLSVPLDSISGEVDIESEIRQAPGQTGRTGAAVGDRFQSKGGTYQAKFTMGSGSYVCTVIVRDRATGKTYGETIDFEVK